MGVNLKELINVHEVELKNLSGQILSVDSFNILYQFLSTIRQADGTPLMDTKGNITSHLVGLFNRTTKLMSKDIKLCFVFDGKAPVLKEAERARRRSVKQEAEKKFLKAKEQHDIQTMKKYAQRMSVLTKDMIDEAKELVSALGLPVIQAPSEGEAQSARMVVNGDCTGVVSQDYDSLLYGANKIYRNLSITGRRRKIGSLGTHIVKPELVDLKENLNNLELTKDQMIVLSMLVGTDYNQGGVKGIGPKKALKLVKEHGDDFDTIFKKVEFDKHCEHDWTEIYLTFKKMPVTDDYDIKFGKIDRNAIENILVKRHNFSEERIENAIGTLILEKQNQTTLGDF